MKRIHDPKHDENNVGAAAVLNAHLLRLVGMLAMNVGQTDNYPYHESTIYPKRRQGSIRKP